MTDYLKLDLLETLVELDQQLADDLQQPRHLLRERDRHVRPIVSELKKHPCKQLSRWLGEVRRNQDHSAGKKAKAAEALLTLLLVMIGFLIGCVSAAAVFRYDGSDPVNVVTVLILFVGLPLITFFLTLLTICPPGVFQCIPGSSALIGGLASLSPGRLRHSLVRILPPEYRSRLEELLAIGRRNQRLFGEFQKWSVIVGAHVLTVALLSGAAIYFLLLIISTDLAFGWSTTLGLESSDIHSITRTLSAPWRNIFPDGDPSLEMIETSRYFRFKDGSLGTENSSMVQHPGQLGGWWPFLLLSIICYGVLPRLLLLFFAHAKRTRTLKRLIVSYPGTETILERLNNTIVNTQSPDPPEFAAVSELPHEPGEFEVAEFPAQAIAINWARAAEDNERLRTELSRCYESSSIEVFAAGGELSLSEDQNTIDRVRNAPFGVGVFVAVRAWEPPTEDCFDFLNDMREASDSKLPITILPLQVSSQGFLYSGAERDLEIWSRHALKTGDPRFFVKKLPDQAS